MRSELVLAAMKYVPNRYQLTHLSAKAIREFHRPNTRIADTANEVLTRFSISNPMAAESRKPEAKSLQMPSRKTRTLRRAG